MNIPYCKDHEITNFRAISLGTLKKGIMYRGGYPYLKDKERDTIYDQLVFDAGITSVINLADNSKDLEILADLVPWYHRLLRDDQVVGLDIQFDFDFLNQFEYEVFNYRLRRGFEFIIHHQGLKNIGLSIKQLDMLKKRLST